MVGRTWVCSVCGYIHEGDGPPDECPVCGVGPEEFNEEMPSGDAAAADPTPTAAEGDYLSEWARFSVEESTKRFVTFYDATRRELEVLARSNGRNRIHDLDLTDVMTISNEVSANTDIRHV